MSCSSIRTAPTGTDNASPQDVMLDPSQKNTIDGSPLPSPLCAVRPPRNQGGEPSIRVLFYGGEVANRLCAADDPGGLGWINRVPPNNADGDNPPDAVCYFLVFGDTFVTVRSADSGVADAQQICQNGLPNKARPRPYWYDPYALY
jgi:hypothetical protein